MRRAMSEFEAKRKGYQVTALACAEHGGSSPKCSHTFGRLTRLRITTAPATCPWKYRLRNIETNRANFACGRLKPLA
jgi:hypothetical protein